MPSKYCGYMGDALWIDLSKKATRAYDISDADRELFVGNKGLAAKILWDNLEPGIDPLGNKNILVVTTAPLTGAGAPCSSRYNISTKSPLTGGITSSNSGGNFGMYLKRAGFDALILAEKAKSPIFIEINNGQTIFHDAKDLWGLDTVATQEKLRETYGKKASMIVIGPAGENIVRYACIMNEERAHGRGGVGAVMGSKNVKAVVAIGDQKPSIAEPEAFKKANKAWVKQLRDHPVTGNTLPKYGTLNLLAKANKLSVLPTRNFQEGKYEHADDIDAEALSKNYNVKNDGCYSCPIRCGRIVEIDGKQVKGPEYETVGMFGASFGNNDLWKICEWNYLMDKLGLDTISAGATISCAAELTEQGLLKSKLKWGETKGIDKLLTQIAYREGLGDDLAEGSMRLAEKYGGPQYAMHAKGMELAAYEPRRSVGMGLGYATANRGGCHINSGYLIYFENLGPVNVDPLSTLGKTGLLIFQQNTIEAISTCGSCIFTSYAIIPGIAGKISAYGAVAKTLDVVVRSSGDLMGMLFKLPPGALPFHLPMIPQSKSIATLTGMKFGAGAFLAAGNRVYNLERLFNVREGLVEDTLPKRLTDEPQDPDDPKTKVPLSEMLPKYYKARGWDERGIPTPKTLKFLGLDFAVDALNDFSGDAKSMQENFDKTRLAYEKKQLKGKKPKTAPKSKIKK